MCEGGERMVKNSGLRSVGRCACIGRVGRALKTEAPSLHGEGEDRVWEVWFDMLVGGGVFES